MNVVKAACSGLCIIVVICGIFSTGRSIPVADSKSVLRIESVQLLLECLPTVFSGEIRFTSSPVRLFPCRMMLPRRIRSSCVTYIDGSHPYWLRNARFSRSRSKDAVHRYRLLHADPGSPHAELVVFCRHYAAIITISVFSDPATPVSAASYRSFIRDSSHHVLSGQSFSREALSVRTMSRPS